MLCFGLLPCALYRDARSQKPWPGNAAHHYWCRRVLGRSMAIPLVTAAAPHPYVYHVPVDRCCINRFGPGVWQCTVGNDAVHTGERTTGDAPAPWDHYIALLVLLLLRPPTAILSPSFITGVSPYLRLQLCLCHELCRGFGLDSSPKVSCGRIRLRRQLPMSQLRSYLRPQFLINNIFS